MSRKPEIWVLADGSPGHRNQSIGLAKKLGLPFEIKEMQFNKLASLPPSLQPASLITLSGKAKADITSPWPELVISAGRRTVPIARWIKKQCPSTRLIQIMDPKVHVDEFDMILVPAHDAKTGGENRFVTLGALHPITHDMLSKAAEIWRPVFEHLPQPRIALMVGGAVGQGSFPVEAAKLLGEAASRMAERSEGSLLVSTSRRTGQQQEAAIKEAIEVPCYWHGWSDTGDNPYLGYLAIADAIIVTGDSVSMISEACFTGVPVYVAQMRDLPEKHRRFHVQMVEKRLVRPFNGSYFEYEYEPLDEASRVVDEVRQRFPEIFSFDR